MLHEANLEAKKQQMQLMIALGSRDFTSLSDARSWQESNKKLFNQYVKLLLGVEVSEEERQEENMLEFYEEVVKQTKPTIRKSRDGKLSVSGVQSVFGRPD